MSRDLRTLVLTIATLLAPPAFALDAGQAEAIDRLAASVPAGKTVSATMASHYAVLLWIEDYCNGRSQESVRDYIMKKGAIDPDQFEVGWLEASMMLASVDPKAMCALALDQYGPDGALIKGGWSQKP